MKSLWRKLGAFLTQLRIWTINLLTLAMVIYLVVVIAALLRQLPARVDPEGRVLIIAPHGRIQDQQVLPTEFNFPLALPVEPQVQSRDLIRVIRAAAEDERLSGVLIDFSKASFSGASTALDIAAELADLRGSGKPVISYGETLGTGAYLMAAQADEVYVHPSGALAISGLGGYRDYTRELTDKLKITMHNYSQGDFKSAVESRTRNDMSDADRLQREALYAPMWQAMKARMASGRGLAPDVFQEMADSHFTPLFREAHYDSLAFAEQAGIIDGRRGFPEFRAWMIERFGEDKDAERETYPHIGAEQYLAQLTQEEEAQEAVAVVFLEGVIQPGKIAPGLAGAEDVSRLIRQAYEHEDTRALVLRVNSPGGSIIASDMIRDEMVAAKSRGMPVIVSMGDVAASGGVWVSTPADRIFARPNTVTGSIGVAIAFPTFENLFDYIGVSFDGVTTSEYAGWGLQQDVDEKLDAVFARWGSSAYNHFIENVARDRERDAQYIRSIAGGRVWTGSKAQELGLVDGMGTLEEAIAAAASQAELQAYRVNYVTLEPSPLVALLQRYGVSAESPIPFFRASAVSIYLERLAQALEGIARPQALVMCTECLVDVP